MKENIAPYLQNAQTGNFLNVTVSWPSVGCVSYGRSESVTLNLPLLCILQYEHVGYWDWLTPPPNDCHQVSLQYRSRRPGSRHCANLHLREKEGSLDISLTVLQSLTELTPAPGSHSKLLHKQRKHAYRLGQPGHCTSWATEREYLKDAVHIQTGRQWI